MGNFKLKKYPSRKSLTNDITSDKSKDHESVREGPRQKSAGIWEH